MYKNGYVIKMFVKIDLYWFGEEILDLGFVVVLSIDNGMVSVLICFCMKI